MEYLIENWPIIVAALALIVVAVSSVVNFAKKPTEEQIKALKEWLLFAVTEAEKELGSGTGKLKLRAVYDKFVDKFPALAEFITFDKFSDYVDEALTRMKELIGSNEKIKMYIESDGEKYLTLEKNTKSEKKEDK